MKTPTKIIALMSALGALSFASALASPDPVRFVMKCAFSGEGSGKSGWEQNCFAEGRFRRDQIDAQLSAPGNEKPLLKLACAEDGAETGTVFDGEMKIHFDRDGSKCTGIFRGRDWNEDEFPSPRILVFFDDDRGERIENRSFDSEVSFSLSESAFTLPGSCRFQRL